MERFQIPLQDKKWIKSYQFWMALSLLIHLVSSYFSVGFHHFDEHFQILEFIGQKIGTTQKAELTWEFHHRIRPWLQPWLYLQIGKGLSLIGLEDKATWATSFRLFSSLIGWASLYLLGLVSYVLCQNLKKVRPWIGPILALTWFYPFIHARASADNLGASFFLIATSLLFLSFKEQKSACLVHRIKSSDFFRGPRFGICPIRALLIGLIFGLSFQFRYQMGISILFLYLWCLCFGQMKIKTGLLMSFSLVLSLGLGIAVDSWGYGGVTFAAWNYFYVDIIQGIKILPNPWYDYFRFAFMRGIPPVSLPFILATLAFWALRPFHLLTWITLPFFLIHSGISHKELRYIFLVALLSPLFIIYCLGLKNEYIPAKKKLWAATRNLLVGGNLILLLVVLFRPANVSSVFYQFMDQAGIKTLYHKGESPYQMLGAPIKFFRPKGLELVQVPGIEGLWQRAQGPSAYFFTRKGRDFFQMKEDPHCELQFLSYPQWVLKFNISNWISRSRIWAVFGCTRP